MARSYGVPGINIAQGATTAAIIAAWLSAAAPTARTRLYEWKIGSDTTPADNASRFQLCAVGTAAPTGGASPSVVVQDPGDPASGCSAMTSSTAGATLSRIIDAWGQNMRATFRWVAVPGKEFVNAATQYSGPAIVLLAQSTAYNLDMSLFWEES